MPSWRVLNFYFTSDVFSPKAVRFVVDRDVNEGVAELHVVRSCIRSLAASKIRISDLECLYCWVDETSYIYFAN